MLIQTNVFLFYKIADIILIN